MCVHSCVLQTQRAPESEDFTLTPSESLDGYAEYCHTLQQTAALQQHRAPHRLTPRHTATNTGERRDRADTLWVVGWVYNTLQHTAADCSTVQYSATHCNTRQHCNSTLQCIAICCSILRDTATHTGELKHTATDCSTAAAHRNILQHMQHTLAHWNTLQHTPESKEFVLTP